VSNLEQLHCDDDQTCEIVVLNEDDPEPDSTTGNLMIVRVVTPAQTRENRFDGGCTETLHTA
jgi:hypothetical protein